MDGANDIPTARDPCLAGAAQGLLQNAAAMQGLAELVARLEPLLAGRRLNNVVDMLSAAADVVDMSDAYMVEKLSKAFEDGMGAAWSVGNAARMAAARMERMEETPSLLGLVRMANAPDVRRGLASLLCMAAALGRQHAYDPVESSAD
ncbi:DUF1641 domain-containing protein [Comamonas endophytica]|uniref:DUF1641 domain-containing protein n=1 Tax=Comamonas endophytica TaxID=2949090 RepID=A0ABY6GEL9_9BURK|nr:MULTISPECIES: DUF1641 domain-containing protein [unclassified Acidovorax]MCD2514274.1 DUF1641 domain-containing protein [Acidovorax sp. D4N7]UYG53525.1 DUF1641 domain-containing protein [Acidovorax sp. 5MLIR]